METNSCVTNLWVHEAGWNYFDTTGELRLYGVKSYWRFGAEVANDDDIIWRALYKDH